MIIRPAVPADAAQMADLINEIIEIGGTTAHKRLFDTARMTAHYIENPDAVACHVADQDGVILGFQSLAWADPAHDGDFVLPADWAIIATFTKVGQTQGGVGTRLFERSDSAGPCHNQLLADDPDFGFVRARDRRSSTRRL